MFLKQERPKMDDFERKEKNFGFKRKTLQFPYFKKIMGKMV